MCNRISCLQEKAVNHNTDCLSDSSEGVLLIPKTAIACVHVPTIWYATKDVIVYVFFSFSISISSPICLDLFRRSLSQFLFSFPLRTYFPLTLLRLSFFACVTYFHSRSESADVSHHPRHPGSGFASAAGHVRFCFLP
jgi:hypothetical protein